MNFVILICIGAAIFLLQKLINMVWWSPMKRENKLREQGIRGAAYRPLVGSLMQLAAAHRQAKATHAHAPSSDHAFHHDATERILPFIPRWRDKYGRNFFFWYGPLLRLVVTDPELIRRMFADPRKYTIPVQHPAFFQLIGKSLPLAQGDEWTNHRKLLNPFFYTDSLQGLSEIVIATAEEMVRRWSNLVGTKEGEIDAEHEFEELAKDIGAVVVFGGKDAKQGKHIGNLQMQQETLVAKVTKTVYIPGSRFLPTRSNSARNGLQKEVSRLLKQIINGQGLRREQHEHDMVGFMLSSTLPRQQIVEECRIFSIAIYETISIALSWACVLLGKHTDWQTRAREEIRQVLQGNRPTFAILGRLKILNMIVNETLRLYPPVPLVIRGVEKETKLGDLTIPAGTGLLVPTIVVHHDPEIWGPNVAEFDPSRFSEGVSKASKHPMAFMPFTNGPRICIGMNFALMEIKLILCMLLQNFSFLLSPAYQHQPDYGITLKPGKGVQIILQNA